MQNKPLTCAICEKDIAFVIDEGDLNAQKILCPQCSNFMFEFYKTIKVPCTEIKGEKSDTSLGYMYSTIKQNNS